MKQICQFKSLLFLLSIAFFLKCGQPAKKPVYNASELMPFRASEKWGFINRQGQICIPATFDYAERFSHGLSVVRLKNDKFGIIDSTGNFVIPPKYKGIGKIEDKKIIVSTNDKWGVIDLNGKEIIPELYDELRYDEETGLFIFQTKNSVGIINSSAEILFSIPGHQLSDFHSKRAGFVGNYQYGFINNLGETCIKPRYDWAGDFDNGKVFACIKDTFSVLDTAGNVLSVFYRKTETSEMIGKNLLAVFDKNLWTVINTSGNTMISGLNTIGKEFNGGFFAVSKDSAWGFIDSLGQLSIALIYEDVSGFSENVCAAKINKVSGYGYIDTSGKWIIQPAFHRAWPFKNGFAAVQNYSRGERVLKWGYINKSGQMITDFEYDYAGDFENGIARVEIGNKMAYIDTAGKTVWKEQ